MAIPVPDETILGILAAEPQHGYQLLARFQSKADLGRVWTLSTSQLYAVLKRLEADGLIRGKTVQSGDAPPRREYSLSAAGRRRLDAWLEAPQLSASVRQVRVQFISRLYVARMLGRPTQALVDAQRGVCEKQLGQLQAAHQAAPDMEALVLDFVIGQLQAVIAWLDHCQERLVEISPSI
ncbi:MAG TPA: PadR family transcriptional regulator [Anaerolineales bacterium]|nr:PadR family transcriptional regulator [Anaerolineales bacterium]HRQ92093.1 PadR family transcriptional regulator [Anaerolineales bacterium]